MAELLAHHVLRQEHSDALLDDRHGQNVVDGGALLGVPLDHAVDEVAQLRTAPANIAAIIEIVDR